MKKIILALLTASIIISSCDILDKYPHDAVSRDSVSEEDLELFIRAFTATRSTSRVSRDISRMI